MLTFMGLILRENDRGETSKSVTVLTAERGVIDIFVRGGRKSTKNASSTQLFAYSKLCVEEKKNSKDQSMFFLNSSESEKLFYNIRLDPKKTALASYFSELLMYIRTEESGCDEIMRLTLNTLYFLDKGDRDNELLKSIFEFRLLCEAGLRPFCFFGFARRMKLTLCTSICQQGSWSVTNAVTILTVFTILN